MATTLNPNLLLAIPLAPLAGAAIAGLFGTKFFGTFSLNFPGCVAYFVKSTISSSSCFFFICSILPSEGVKYAPKIDRC